MLCVCARTHMLCWSKGIQGSLQMICALSQTNQDSTVRLLNRKNLCPFFLLIFFPACSNSNSVLAIIVFTSLSSSKPTKAKMAQMYPKPTAAVCSPALSRDAPDCPLVSKSSEPWTSGVTHYRGSCKYPNVLRRHGQIGLDLKAFQFSV